ncbi:PREDICTED: melanoma-associated antigen 10-like [Chinchilla lanigera]|uniref:melanoma-associated antigen 10-like n=1 Tax=Chinchilla lanigera TaxID=34839 RepID=UPI00038EE931|nr:PREDICTED: melanoma-associated antigen 10-like [Chinchilla lanigera]
MSQPRKRLCYMPEEDPEDQSERQSDPGARVPVPVEDDSSSSSSTSSSSLPTSTDSSSFSSSSPTMSSAREDFTAAESSGSLQSLQGACSSLPAVASTLWSPSDEDPNRQGVEGQSTCQELPDTEFLSKSEKDEKVTNLVNFLLLKYQMQEPVTEAEIMDIIHNYSHFSVIFDEAFECLQLVFGIELKDVKPPGQAYVLAPILGISYDGVSSEVQGMPKTGLLVLILSIIFLHGDCAPEEEIWQTLNVMGILPGTEHFIYGEPRKLILEDFVQEQYLVYRQVPNSDPPRYEFLWGPRTHAEITKMQILQFLSSIGGNDPRSFTQRYEEALRDEEERAQARNATTSTLASASSSATTSFPSPE